ncbi:ABC transporter ATP-binding protein [Nocardioides sp. MAHUQ-72]|uniref:ABC transporter ATP-binding protein n=1 Tax=unclassified Nocardioides TaxID=2615069 RepID=UPI00360BEBF8
MTSLDLDIRDLVIEYPARRGSGVTRAVDGVNLQLNRGEFVGIVGESGSGKSSIANAIMGLAPITSGELWLGDTNLGALRGRRARHARRRLQLVMQDPFEALDPHMNVHRLIEEPLIVHRFGLSRAERRARVRDALERVGLSPAEEFENRRPHELSGGQRQRVCVAACLIVDPFVVIADEPVSMLDVSVRAGVLHTLDASRRRDNAAVLMITHDLPTAAAFCDRLIVMHQGRVVEQGTAADVVENPSHRYTRELLNATPALGRQDVPVPGS